MTERAPEPTADLPAERSGLTGPLLWAGVAWLTVATCGLVPTGMLFAQGVFAMVGFMVGVAFVGLPLYTLFELWHTRTVAAAVRSAMYSFSLAALVLAFWIGGSRSEWAIAGISALLVVPGVLSLLAARQLHVQHRPPSATGLERTDAAEPLSAAEMVVIVLLLIALLVAAFVLLGPTFSVQSGP